MSFFGDLERFFAEVIFPYRLPLAIAILVGVGLLALAAWRGRWDRPVRRHPRRSLAIALPILALALPAGWYLGSPLFIRTELVETPAPATAGQEATPVLAGTFQGADEFHFGRGRATLLINADGSHTLQFESFSVLNGPDLYVYLSPSADGYADGAVEIGKLKATGGAFSYQLDAGTDVSAAQSVVIWCRPFGVQFAHAELSAP